MRLLARWAAPLAAIGFVAAVCAALWHAVPDDIDSPLTPLALLKSQRLLPIPALATSEGRVSRQLDLLVSDRARLSDVDELRLVVHGYGLSSRLLGAWLELPGNTCSFTASGRTLNFSDVLRLSRDRPCADGTGPARATLTLQFAAGTPYAARVALWIAPAVADGAPLLTVDGQAGATPVGHAARHRSLLRVRTITLLAWMWEASEAAIWTRVAVAGLLLFAGAALASGAVRAMPAALAAACLGTGLALFYVVIVPPLQAPDEPDHLLSFAAVTDRTEFPVLTAAWAQRVHFDRMVFRTGERFTPADRDMPFERAWAAEDVFAEDVANRSSSATRWWQVMARLTPADPARTLLRLRTADAILFGLALGAGTAVVGASGAVVAPAALALILLAIPTLPFFAMQLSETSVNVVAFILIGYAAAAMLAEADNPWTGLLLGTATALLAAGTRSGWPLAGAIGGLLAARIVSRAGSSAGGPGFWGGFAGPFVLLFGSGLFYVPLPGFDQWHLPGLDSPAPVNTVTVVASAIALAAIGYGAERAWVRVGPRKPARLYLVRPVLVAGAIGIAVTLAASAIVQLPVIPPIEGLSGDLRDYVGRVLLSVLTIARVSGADFFAWTSFLGALGWLDTLLPPRLLTGLTVLGALAAIWMLVSAARDADGRRGAIAVLAGLGILASVAGCAIGSYGLNRNIHGRYLLGPYVVAIALLCSAPMLAPVRWLSGTARASALVVFVLAVHAIAMWVVLGRYFG